MMERSCYGQAVKTLRDAAIVVRLACAAAQSIEATSNTQTIQAKITDAYRRAARPMPSVPVTHLKIVSENAAFDNSLFSSIIQQECCHEKTSDETSHWLFRISDHDLCLFDDQAFELCTVLILFNFSVASTCCTFSSNRNGTATRNLRHDAATVLLLCQDLLASLYQSNMDKPFMMHQLSFIASLVLQELVFALKAIGKHEEAILVDNIRCEICIASSINLNCIDQAGKIFFGRSQDFAPAA